MSSQLYMETIEKNNDNNLSKKDEYDDYIKFNNIIEKVNDIPSIFHYVPNFLTDDEETSLYEYLENTKDFIANPKYKNGYSRLQKWFHIDNKYFCSKWHGHYKHWESFDLDEMITTIIQKVQNYINTIAQLPVPIINSCLINKYNDGNNFIAPHRDSEISFGANPTIVVLSIGENRSLYFDENDTKNTFSFKLMSGSVLIMSGSSQRYYKHYIKKDDTVNVRYSLTFREHIIE